MKVKISKEPDGKKYVFFRKKGENNWSGWTVGKFIFMILGMITCVVLIVCLLTGVHLVKQTHIKKGYIRDLDGKQYEVDVESCNCYRDGQCRIYTTDGRIISAGVNNVIIEEYYLTDNQE